MSDFLIRVMLALKNKFGSVFLVSILWKYLYMIGIISSLNIWKNSLVKITGPGGFLERGF